MQPGATAPIMLPTSADIAAIRRQHVPVRDGRQRGEYCDCCSQDSPGDVAIVLAHIDDRRGGGPAPGGGV